MSDDKLAFALTPQPAYRELAEAQRRLLRDAADRIERGDPLAGLQADFAAAAVRAFADRIPDEPPRRRSRGRRPQKMDPEGVVLHYVMYRLAGMNQSEAHAKIAEQACATIDAVKQVLQGRVKG
jgi:hypothetical protein